MVAMLDDTPSTMLQPTAHAPGAEFGQPKIASKIAGRVLLVVIIIIIVAIT